MRHATWLLFLPLGAVAADQDSLANLVYLNDRLELHPRVGLSARYDSNVDATVDDPEDELAAIATAGIGALFAWSESTTLTADGEFQLVVTDRPGEERWRNQGTAQVAIQRKTPQDAAGARIAYARNDDPDEQTGERLLVDTWSGQIDGELIGPIHHVSGALGIARSDYQQSSRLFSADDRDQNTVTASLGYGLRLEAGDEITLRASADRVLYDQHTTNQDSTGIQGLVGWSHQVSETIGLAIEGGAEYRRYDDGAGRPAEDILSPSWLVSGRTVTLDESTWALTFSGRVEDNVTGNPALASRADLDYTHPITPLWSVRAGIGGYNLYDLESSGGQPQDERWTGRGTVGTSYAFRPGMSGDLQGGYEYSDSRLDGTYDRIVALAGVTARF